MIRLVLIIVAVSYLLGSIPFGYLLVRVFRGEDVRATGSGNIGATNVARTGAKGLAIATLLLDALKGYAAVAIAFWLANAKRFQGDVSTSIYHQQAQNLDSQNVFFLAALAAFVAILGHIFTVWLRFKGGKGVAAAAGAFAALDPRAMLFALLAFVVVFILTRYVSLGSIAAAIVFPFLAWWTRPEMLRMPVALLIGASSLLIIVRHKDNIGRLLTGAESRFR